MSTKNWFKERFPIDYEKFVEINENIFMKEPIPNHMKKWWYCSQATEAKSTTTSRDYSKKNLNAWRTGMSFVNFLVGVFNPLKNHFFDQI